MNQRASDLPHPLMNWRKDDKNTLRKSPAAVLVVLVRAQVRRKNLNHSPYTHPAGETEGHTPVERFILISVL